MSRQEPRGGGWHEALDADNHVHTLTGNDEEVLVARLMAGDTVLSEQKLDWTTLADLVHEAIEESQRTRGANAQTTWWDAAAAADLILFHVTQLGDVDHHHHRTQRGRLSGLRPGPDELGPPGRGVC